MRWANEVVKAFTKSLHVTCARIVIPDPSGRDVGGCASARPTRLLDDNCRKLSAAVSRTSKGRYLIACGVTNASEDAPVEFSRNLAQLFVVTLQRLPSGLPSKSIL